MLDQLRQRLGWGAPLRLTSRVCTEPQFAEPWHTRWSMAFRDAPRHHRKQWEFTYICQALFERGMLAKGKGGLGFGTGDEPLPSLFASLGCWITASDLPPDRARHYGWSSWERDTLQARLNSRGLCAPEEFAARVRWLPVDMNEVPAHLQNFDFCWSSCALEHTGTLLAGLNFIRRSLRCLRPGGVAVHTTEFNLSSDTKTVFYGDTVIYRRQDIERLVEELQQDGHKVTWTWSEHEKPLSYWPTYPLDLVDGSVVIDIGPYAATSVGLIIQRGKA